MDICLFLISKIREIYKFFFEIRGKKIEKEQIFQKEKEEKRVEKIIKEKDIDELNKEIGWKNRD